MTFQLLENEKRLLLRRIHKFKSGFDEQYGPYSHFGYWTLISDPDPNKVAWKIKDDVPKVPNHAKAERNGAINPQNYNFSQF